MENEINGATEFQEDKITLYMQRYPFKLRAICPDKMGIYRVPDGCEIWFEQKLKGENNIFLAAWLTTKLCTDNDIHNTVTEFRAGVQFTKANPGELFLESRGFTKH